MVDLDQTFIRLGYVGLLKHYQLCARGRAARPVETFEEWHHWMRSKVGLVPAYERQVVLDDLFGATDDRRYVSGLLRLGGREPPSAVRKKLRNAAWDLFHLRMVDGHSTLPDFPGGRNYAALATRDGDIVGLRRRIEAVASVERGELHLPVHLAAFPRPRQRTVSDHDLMTLALRVEGRAGDPSPPDLDALLEAQAELERELEAPVRR